MNLPSLVDNLIADTLVSLRLFWPELTICATIVVLLFVRLFRLGERINPFWIALAGSVVAFCLAHPPGGIHKLGSVAREEIFTGMLVYDSLTVFFRLFLLFFAVLFIVLVRMTGLADKQDGQDLYALLLGATLGMCLMASANHLMTIFLAVEMASVPSYVLAGILKGRRRASEAALKYAVYGAGAAGVMLYGISLLAGLLGTAHLPTIAGRLTAMDIPTRIAALTAGDETGGTLMVLALAAMMIMVGLAFKLSAVPFHFWCPDVFDGAAAEIGAFLSVASKGAAMALLVRVALGVSMVPVEADVAEIPRTIPAQMVSLAQDTGGAAAAEADEAAPSRLDPVRTFIVQLIAVLAAITCTFGNLAAYGQTNIKRLLAYSTIAHAGYMMMAVAAAVHLTGSNAAGAREAVAALIYYLIVYLFMNLGAFAIVAFLRNAIGSEEIADFAGLIRTAPLTAVALTVILTGLIGLPPGVAGLFAKIALFRSLIIANNPWTIALLAIAGLNTAVSLVYYLRVAKTVCIDPEPESRGPVSIGLLPAAYVFALAVPVFLLGILPQVTEMANHASEQLLR